MPSEQPFSLFKFPDMFERVFYGSPIPFAISDTDSTILAANDSFCELLHYTRAELVGQRALALGIWQDPQQREEIIQHFNKNSLRLKGTVPLRTKNGEIKDTAASSERIEHAGKIIFVTQFFNLTENLETELQLRKKTEENLRQEKTLVAAILDNANALILVLDAHDCIVLYNKTCETLIGRKLADVVGKNIFALKLVPPDEQPSLLERYQQFKSTRTKKFYYENSWISPTGERHQIGWSSAIIPDEDGLLKFIVSIGIDLTDNKNLQLRLQTSEARYQKLFMELPLSTLEIDQRQTDGKMVIKNANRKACRMYGVNLSNAQPLLLEQIFAEPHTADVEKIATAAAEVNGSNIIKSVHRHANGDLFPVRITVAINPDPASHFLLVIEDNSAEANLRSEDQAITQERERIAREIHDGIAQDLASLRIRANYWLMLLDKDPEKLRPEIAFLQQQLAVNIQEVRRSIFALRPLVLEEKGFLAAIQEYIHEFAELNHIQVQTLIAQDMPALSEEVELSVFRIIQEGLNNIAKHTQADHVCVKMECLPDHHLYLEIRDNGQGFDTHLLKANTHPEHLGIAMIKERVLEKDGKFELISIINQGTTLIIQIPV